MVTHFRGVLDPVPVIQNKTGPDSVLFQTPETLLLLPTRYVKYIIRYKWRLQPPFNATDGQSPNQFSLSTIYQQIQPLLWRQTGVNIFVYAVSCILRRWWRHCSCARQTHCGWSTSAGWTWCWSPLPPSNIPVSRTISATSRWRAQGSSTRWDLGRYLLLIKKG